ncbi:MAG TPA: hypothetical protein VFZ48_05295 [Candidatus Saccharimonadales bacterium]
MGAIEALSNRFTPVQRLLDLAKTWFDTPNGAGPAPPPKSFKTLRKLKPHELDELVEQYQAGSSVYQLAKHYGIHRITIGKHLRSRGIDTTAPALTGEQVREAAQLYATAGAARRSLNTLILELKLRVDGCIMQG